jgi:hypothetical protein
MDPHGISIVNLLDRLDGEPQGAVPARGAFEERPEIESRQEPGFALEHLDRQIVAVVEDGVARHSIDAAPHGSLSLAGLKAGVSALAGSQDVVYRHSDLNE